MFNNVITSARPKRNKSNTVNNNSGDIEKIKHPTYGISEKPSYDQVRHFIQKYAVPILILILLGVFLAEALIMVFINKLPGLTLLAEILIDAGILMMVLFPLLFFLIFRPLLRNIQRQEKLQAELEMRVQERTRELQTSNILLHEEILRREKIEEQISLERKRLFSVLNELPASVHLVGPDYKIRFANRYFLEHFGPEDRPCYKILHDVDEPCIVCHAREVFQQNCPGIFEELHKDNRLYRLYNYPFIDTDGSKLVLQLGLDITEQKKAENALRYSESRFRLLVNSITDTVFTLDKSMSITELYGDLAAKLGLSPESYIGKRVSEVFDPETTKIHEEYIRKALTGEHTVYEWVMNIKDGKRHIQSSMAPIVYADGQIEGVVGVARDITSKKMLEKQIIETEKLMAVARMSAMISHEFRNSLTSVHMILELLLEATPDQKSLEVALSSVNHMEQIVSQMLRFSKPLPMMFKPENLNRILKESIDLVSGQITKNKISLQQSLSKNLPELSLDANHLKEAFVNLLLNSIQSIAMGGKDSLKREIKIISRKKHFTSWQEVSDQRNHDMEDHAQFRPGSFQIVEISDTGKGIKKEYIEQIFDPFFTTKRTGTGLGLAMVKRTFEAHNGFIQVKSRHGRGTRFIIYLSQDERVDQ